MNKIIVSSHERYTRNRLDCWLGCLAGKPRDSSQGIGWEISSACEKAGIANHKYSAHGPLPQPFALLANVDISLREISPRFVNNDRRVFITLIYDIVVALDVDPVRTGLQATRFLILKRLFDR